MKKIFTLLFVSSLLLSCTVNSGDPGPMGPQGPPGTYVVGQVFEIENVDFNAANNYSFYAYFDDFIPNTTIYQSDIVLVYLWEGTYNGNDIWSLMPQTFYMAGGGILEYNFNHTDEDFEIYLNGNGNFGNLEPSFTQNKIFRVAVIPADFAIDGKYDFSNYYDLMEALEIKSEDQIQKIKIEE